MIDLTAEQRRGMRDSRKRFIQHCRAVVRCAAAEIWLNNEWNEGGAVGDPPADREAALLRLQFAMRAQLLAHWSVQVPARWLRIIYDLPDPEPTH